MRLIYADELEGRFGTYEYRARFCRVGQRLGKLAREDRVTQLRPIYGAGACAWAPAGVTTANLDAQTRRRYAIVRHAVRVATMPSPSEPVAAPLPPVLAILRVLLNAKG